MHLRNPVLLLVLYNIPFSLGATFPVSTEPRANWRGHHAAHCFIEGILGRCRRCGGRRRNRDWICGRFRAKHQQSKYPGSNSINTSHIDAPILVPLAPTILSDFSELKKMLLLPAAR